MKEKFEKILKFFTKSTIFDKDRQKLFKIYFNFDKICTIIKVFSGNNVKGVKKMKNDLLKTLAMKAKNRMINKSLRDTYSNANIKIISTNDQAFYDKVKEIVNNEEYVLNPLQRLMDQDKMLKMDARAKERYLLETIEKYQKAKTLIESENQRINI